MISNHGELPCDLRSPSYESRNFAGLAIIHSVHLDSTATGIFPSRSRSRCGGVPLSSVLNMASNRIPLKPVTLLSRNDEGSLRQKPNVLTTSAADECAALSFPSSSRPAPYEKSATISGRTKPSKIFCLQSYAYPRSSYCEAGDASRAPANNAA